MRGTDHEIYMQIRRANEVQVRLEHIRWAREWIATEWLRGDMAQALKRHQRWLQGLRRQVLAAERSAR
jgi:hypothetical protein